MIVNYVAEYANRQRRLLAIKDNAIQIYGLRQYYKTRPYEWIIDWVETYDPRNAGTGVPTRIPFILFNKQRELVEFLYRLIGDQENGLIEKGRDMGATWTCCAFSVWAWSFMDGASVGWGSRKEDLVDRIGDPDSIFEKIRMIIAGLPRQLLPIGFNPKIHSTFMKLINPENLATITGESGDNIGRGGRKMIYFKDESAHYERPELIEAALADNTRVQVDISSVNGSGNVFHRRRRAGLEWPAMERGRTRVFIMDWRDNPFKNQEWYDQRRRKAVDEGLLHVFEQEVNRNYAASVEGVIIKPEWIMAAIDAHIKLGFTDEGGWMAALDVADGGGDRNAFTKRKGVILKVAQEWGADDVGETARRAIMLCADTAPHDLQYDVIGVGSGVKAEANRLAKEDRLPRGLRLVPWNAGAAVLMPDRNIIPGDRLSALNKDFYKNLKAQAWWQLGRRFERTWRAVNEPDFTWKAEQLISLDSRIPLIRKIEMELAQATIGYTTSRLQLIVNKTPEGTFSPNLADSIVMNYWPVRGTGYSFDQLTKALA